MNKVKIGIIGIGNIGTSHIKEFTEDKIEKANITAVCDINEERLKVAKELLGDDIKCFDNTDDFFASKLFDAVVVATPHYSHPPLIIEALEKGYHALTEKPAGVYTKQVREMNEAAKKSDKVFGIMFNQRTNPLYKKIKEMVESGELGDIKRTNWIVTNWYRSQSYYDSGGWRATWVGEGGGVLSNQDPHQLDLWQWMCGMPKRVRATCYEGKYHNIEVEDDVTAYVEYENGATGVFVTSTGDCPGTNRFELSSDMGKLVAEDDKLKFYKLEMNEREFNATCTKGFGCPKHEVIDVETDGENTQHAGILNDWVEAILTGSKLLAPGIEGINGLQLCNAMMLSSWIDDWVEIPVDEDLFLEKLNEKIKNSSLKKETKEIVSDTSGTY